MLRARLYYNTRTPLLRHVPFLAWPRFITAAYKQTDRMYVHVRDQNDNTMYASTGWVLTVRHFLVCEYVAGGSQQSGGKLFFMKYDGLSGGSLL